MDIHLKTFTIFAVAVSAFILAGCGDPDPAVLIEDARKATAEAGWSEVLEITEELEDISPGDPNTWLFKAMACENTGDIQGALEASARGAELCPESFYCQYNYGRLLALAGSNGQDAFKILARAFKLAPNNTDCLQLLIQNAAKMNMDPSSFYNRLNQLDPEAAGKVELQTSMGIYMVTANPVGSAKWNNGMIFLQNAYNKSANNPVTALNFARALDRSPKYRKAAVPVYEKYLSLARNNPEAAGGTAEAEARIKAIQRNSR